MQVHTPAVGSPWYLHGGRVLGLVRGPEDPIIFTRPELPCFAPKLGLVPPLFVLFLLYMLPETPRYLFVQGNGDEVCTDRA